MPRRVARALAGLGAALLGIAAALGVLATAAYLALASPLGRAWVTPRLVTAVDDAIQGRVELRSFAFEGGGVALRGLVVRDPEGEAVIAAERAFAAVDLTRIRGRRVGVRITIDRPEVLLAQDEEGRLGIARAFAPSRPSREEEEKAPSGPSPWTVEVTRLSIRGGAARWLDAAGHPRFAVDGLDLDLAGAHGPAGSRVAVKARGALREPADQPLAVEAAASLRQGEVEVPLLRAKVGETALDALGAYDLATRRGRAAILSFAVSRDSTVALVPRAPLAGDLAGVLYAESDGAVATAGLQLRPAGGDDAGRADAAAAVRLTSPLAAGLELAVHRLDPERVLAAAPDGELTFTARGRVLGTDPATLRAAVALDAQPSRLRGGRVQAVHLRGAAAAGTFTVEKLRAAVPGARLEADGRYALDGALGARARLEATDLAAAARHAGELAGIELPALRGAATVEARASGAARAPSITARIASPRFGAPGVDATGVALQGELAGPLRAPRVRVDGGAATVVAGGRTARDVSLRAALQGRDAEARVTAMVKEFGEEPVTVGAKGAFSPDRKVLDVSALDLSWPGTKFALARPARLDLALPRVDRLELASGPQRVAVEGGFAARPGRPGRKVLDARAFLEAFDVGRLPRGLVPPDLAIAGVVSASAWVVGEPARPSAEGRVTVEQGAALGVEGLSIAADGAYDGVKRRVRASAGVRRAAGGEVELRAEVPVGLVRAPETERLSVEASVRAIPVAEALRVARSTAPLAGTAEAELSLTGTVGAPSITARASLADGRWAEQGPFALRAAVEAPGKEAQFEAAADWAGARAVDVSGAVPLDTAELVHAPARAFAKLPRAPVDARVFVPNFELAKVAGVFGLPADLGGVLTVDGAVKGTVRAPRGEVGIDGTGLAGMGWKGADVHAVVALGDGVTAVAGDAAFAGAELVQFQGSLYAAPESLGEPGVAERAPFDLEAIVPGADLSRIGSRTPLAGHVIGRVHASGTVEAPLGTVALRGERIVVAGTPLGDLDLNARAFADRVTAEAKLAAAKGGLLTANLQLSSGLGASAVRDGALAKAPAEARVVADRVDLGFLPAVLPGTIRSAGGELGADVVAKGTLARLRPQGKLRVTGGRAAISEMGEWTGIEVDAIVAEDVLRVARLEAQRGRGRLDAKAEARGLALRDGPGQFTAELRARDLAIPKAGQDLVTLEDLTATAKGTFDASALRAEVQVPGGVVRLPRRTPRELQTLDVRDDIVIGQPKRKPRKHGEAAAPGEEEARPYRVVVHAVVPNRLFVRSDNPKLDVELKADATFDVIGARVYSEGSVEVVRGEVEPISGRRFEVERGRVTFTGGEPKDAVLDVVARYENPAAKVTVNVSGPTAKPVVKMTSEPPMDEGQIAILIATGRTELKAGSGGVGTLTGQQAGMAALGAVATRVFSDLVADKLPLDTVALESTQKEGATSLNIRAGKYVTDKIYVGYTRSFEAQLEKGENQNEVRVEYQISPRWTFESRYGDGKSGGASLIWSKDY